MESFQTHQFIDANTTFPAAIQAWESHLNDQGRSLYTIKAFRGDIQLLASYLPPDKTLGTITTRDINAFLEWMNNERRVPCSPKTYSRRVTSIKAFFRWLTTFGIIPSDPAEKVIQMRAVSPLQEILTKEELERAFSAANAQRVAEKPDARNAALLELLIFSGIKKGEALDLSPNHIERDDPDAPILHIRYTNPENRYKDRMIELPKEWLNVYDEYRAQYRPTDKIFPWTARRLEYLLEDIGKAAGLEKHLSFAMCRWTCAVKDICDGMHPEAVRTKLGVSKIQWKEIFHKINKLKNVYLMLPPDSTDPDEEEQKSESSSAFSHGNQANGFPTRR